MQQSVQKTIRRQCQIKAMNNELLPDIYKKYSINFIGIFVALFLAAILYSYQITGDLYGDEVGHTYKVVAAEDFWSVIKNDIIIHPPFYFVLAKYSRDIVGKDWAIRIPSLLFSLGTILFITLAVRRYIDNKYMLYAAFLATFSPFLLEFAAEGRPYAMMIFFSVAFIWFFLKFLEEENVKSMLFLGMTALCGALTHYLFWPLLVAIAIYYISVKRRVSKYAFGAFTMVAVIIIPLGVYLFLVPKVQYAGYVQDTWAKNYFNIPNFLSRLVIAINFGYSTFNLPQLDPGRNVTVAVLKENWLLISSSLFSLSGIFFSLVRLARKGEKRFWFFLICLVVPLVLGLGAGMSGKTLLREKHLAVIWAPYFFLLIMALGYLVQSRTGKVVIICYAAVVAVSLFHYIAFPNEYTRRMDWTGLNSTLTKDVQADDLVVIYTKNIKHLSLGKMNVLDSDIKQVAIQTERPAGLSLSDYVRQLDKAVHGSIYLISHEEQRMVVDPENEAYRLLKDMRNGSEKRFGRNLILYVFK